MVRRPRTRGFTLIELMLTITVLAIFATIALPSFSYLTRSTRIKNSATTVYLALMKARSEAVKRNAAVTITATGGNWASGWTMTDSGGTILQNQEALKGVTVTVTGLATPTSVVFVGSGRVQGAAAPAFSITYPNATSADPQRCVSTSPSGSPFMKQAACS